MFKLLLVFSFVLTLNSIYDININDINGNEIQLSSFKGKKILIVNTASGSKYVNQFASLEKLYQQYKNNLVVIAVPSNSFGNESAENASILQFVAKKYNIHFILAEKTEVTGDNMHLLYNWLTQYKNNQVMDNKIKGDFYKFLINESGNLIGVFNSSVDPVSDEMQSAVGNN